MFDVLGQTPLWTGLTTAASWGFIGAGALLCVIGGIGMLRLPDLYTRVHAASVADTGGMLLIFIGLMIQAGLGLVTLKLALIALLRWRRTRASAATSCSALPVPVLFESALALLLCWKPRSLYW